MPSANIFTPTGFRHSAQGCEERATLGTKHKKTFPLSSRRGRRGKGRGGFSIGEWWNDWEGGEIGAVLFPSVTTAASFQKNMTIYWVTSSKYYIGQRRPLFDPFSMCETDPSLRIKDSRKHPLI